MLLHYIRKTACIAITACCSFHGFAQDTVMFHGGYQDGFASALDTNFTPQALPHQYAYTGGDNHGYSRITTDNFVPDLLDQFTPYTSSTENDGYAGQLVVNVPLAEDFVSFTGEVVENSSLLKWVVANEENITRYELERSRNGKSYSNIYTRNIATPSPTRSEIQYLDKQPQPGKNFYRLKIFEQDEKCRYSNIVLLIFDENNKSIVIYPNPAKLSFSVRTDQKINGIILFNMAGQEIRRFPVSLDNNYSLSGVPSGNYIINIHFNNRTVSIKLTVQ